MEWPNASWENDFRLLNCHNWGEIFLHACMCRIEVFSVRERFHRTAVLQACQWKVRGWVWEWTVFFYRELTLLGGLVNTCSFPLSFFLQEQQEWSVFLPQKVTLLDAINTTVKLLMIIFENFSYLLLQLVSCHIHIHESLKIYDYFPLQKAFKLFRDSRHIPSHWLARELYQSPGEGNRDALTSPGDTSIQR